MTGKASCCIGAAPPSATSACNEAGALAHLLLRLGQQLPQLLCDKRHEGVQQPQPAVQRHPQRLARRLLGGGCACVAGRRQAAGASVRAQLRQAQHAAVGCASYRRRRAMCSQRSNTLRAAVHRGRARTRACRLVSRHDWLHELDEHVTQVVLPPGVQRLRGGGEVVRLHRLAGGTRAGPRQGGGTEGTAAK